MTEENLNLAALEKRLIEKAIRLYGFYNRPKIFEVLGLQERTFYNKLKQHNIPYTQYKTKTT